MVSSNKNCRSAEFLALFSTLRDGVILFDLQGTIVLGNDRAKEILGLTTDLDLEEFDFALLTQNPHWYADIFSPLLAGQGSRPFRTQWHRADTWVPLEIRVNLVKDKDQNPLSFQCVLYDLSEGQKYQGIVDGTHAGTWEWNVQTGHTVFNARWAEIVGYTLEELAPISIKTWLSLAHPEDLAESEKLLEAHFRRETPYYDCESRMKHKDGSWVWVQDRGKVMAWTDEGKPLVMFGTHIDITLRKHSEFALLEAKTAAELATRSKSKFLAYMSHELRTPLNGLLGFIDILSQTTLSKTQRQYLNNAQASGKGLLEIINDVLDYSKIEAGMLEIVPRPTDLVNLCRRCIEMIRPAAEQKGLKLLLDLDPTIPATVSIDPVRVRQVFSNLLSNAVKFTPKGEVELKVLYLPKGKTKGQFLCSVRDTGVGISKDQGKLLFREFSQAHNASTENFGGTGLGLVISEKILSQMGGNIRYESTRAKGTVFFVDFLASGSATGHEAGSEAVPEPQTSQALSGTPQILVAEDVAMNRMLIRSLLKKIVPGAQVREAENGQEAVSLVRSRDFDLIFMDVQMPVLDGIQATLQIRGIEQSTSSHRSVPIIAMTAGVSPAEKEACKNAGMNEFLSKPLDARGLRDLLTHLLRDTTLGSQ